MPVYDTDYGQYFDLKSNFDCVSDDVACSKLINVVKLHICCINKCLLETSQCFKLAEITTQK